MLNTKKVKFSKKTIIIFSIILLIPTLFFIYVSIYYKADLSKMSDLPQTNITKYRYVDEDGNIIFGSEACQGTGFILYPGGKVDEHSYEALASLCAEKGIKTFIVSMPFNLAVFDISAAENIINNNQNIQNWYIGGHSLGGSMAASYASTNPDLFDGLILLASYSTEKIPFKVLSIYGSEDMILNSKKYLEYRTNISSNLYEYKLEGGNHAFFGTYGVQSGDGIATISNIEQLTATAEMISDFIFLK